MSFVSSINPVPNKPNAYVCYAKKAFLKYKLLAAAKAGQSVYENEYNKLSNLPYALNLNNHISIKDIFFNHWDEFVAIQNVKGKHIRKSIMDNVDKMINCRNFKNGYLFFECHNCNNFHIQGLSCHSRFCVSCGKKYRDSRALEISKTCIKAPHRHITWTISESLRSFFQTYRQLYDELFAAVNDVLTYLIQGKSKKAKIRHEKLGFISTIHTFGRDVKFNPHIHTLVAECTIDKFGVKKNYDYFNYKSLRKSFMNQLLKRMLSFLKLYASNEELIKFYKIKNHLFKTYDNGFYVHAPQIKVKSYSNIKRIVNYVCRYAGHPAMSESRILSYDKDSKIINYYYDPHEDDAITNPNDKVGRQFVSESVYEFIAKLIVHIPQRSVHTTRYYGFYANHSSIDLSNKELLYNDFELKYMKSVLSWRHRLIMSYNYDPLICHCGGEMKICPDFCWFPAYRKDG